MLPTSFGNNTTSALEKKPQVVVGVFHVGIWCNACEQISIVQGGSSYIMV